MIFVVLVFVSINSLSIIKVFSSDNDLAAINQNNSGSIN